MRFDNESPREALVKTNTFNTNYPKLLIDKDGIINVVEKGPVSLAGGEVVAEPTDNQFGVDYSLLTFDSNESSYVIRYVSATAPTPILTLPITSINAVEHDTIDIRLNDLPVLPLPITTITATSPTVIVNTRLSYSPILPIPLSSINGILSTTLFIS